MFFDYTKLATDSWQDGLMIFFGIIFFILFVIWFIDSLSKAVLLKKAGKSIFIGFIPYYNDYCLCKISGTNLIWFYMKVGLPFLLSLMESMITSAYSGLSSLSLFAIIGYAIALNASISKSFDRGMGTTVCLIIFPHITRFIVAFRGKYLGPVGCNDVIFSRMEFGKTAKNDYYNYSNNTNPMGIYNYDTINNTKYNFCPKCGNAVTEYDRFCNKCGREI